MLNALQAYIDKLAATEIANNALKAGSDFPDFELVNATYEMVSLKSLLKKSPLIINFYRGSWCPYCNFELQAYQQLLPEIKAAGGQLVAISPQQVDNSLDTVEKNNLQFEVLSDHNNVLADKLGIRFDFDSALKPIYEQLNLDLGKMHGVEDWQLPIPATYVVDQRGSIVLASVNADYTSRLEPEEAIAALKSIN
jgi:peroxiredoxin